MVLVVTELLNIDANQKCSFVREKIARYGQMLVVTEIVASDTQCM